ncbi:MAG TPA: flavodoxin-dependent (E)-4-hydroxy-3-methylbut-2-enyl-diphosphate synthase [Candidatus Cloacimonadota bacterium]|nr:flavodoxin-dependent (E)-4-hydroxy-3-methylbut-2-enyl-diphosphate synthase [Candidatus Cloacimonadota bacterium]
MMKIERKQTRQIKLGDVLIGGGAPVSIQSMLTAKTSELDAATAQIRQLANAGAELIRFSVMDLEDAAAIPGLKRNSPVPLIADIHFDYKLALAALDNGIDGLRINPGNIGSHKGVELLVASAKEKQVPIRIGVNSGSLPKELISKYGVSAQAMVEAALGHIHLLEELNYEQIKISVKASQLDLMLDSYRLLSQTVDYPLHLGLTEAGTLLQGSIKSSIGLGLLLAEGIGDTIRVSLTADPILEIKAAREILKVLGLRGGLNIISCPTCGRTRINLIQLAERVEQALAPYANEDLTIAVMGCAVNGPGEAREADFGIAGGQGEGLLFAHGEILKKVPESQLLPELIALVEARIKGS